MLRNNSNNVSLNSAAEIHTSLKSSSIEIKFNGDSILSNNNIRNIFIGILTTFTNLCSNGIVNNKLDRSFIGDMLDNMWNMGGKGIKS